MRGCRSKEDEIGRRNVTSLPEVPGSVGRQPRATVRWRVKRVQAETDTRNLASACVLEKRGRPGGGSSGGGAGHLTQREVQPSDGVTGCADGSAGHSTGRPSYCVERTIEVRMSPWAPKRSIRPSKCAMEDVRMRSIEQ